MELTDYARDLLTSLADLPKGEPITIAQSDKGVLRNIVVMDTTPDEPDPKPRSTRSRANKALGVASMILREDGDSSEESDDRVARRAVALVDLVDQYAEQGWPEEQVTIKASPRIDLDWSKTAVVVDSPIAIDHPGTAKPHAAFDPRFLLTEWAPEFLRAPRYGAAIMAVDRIDNGLVIETQVQLDTGIAPNEVDRIRNHLAEWSVERPGRQSTYSDLTCLVVLKERLP